MPQPAHLHLEIVTPDHAVIHEEVDEVEIPASEGYLGIRPGHAPLLAKLRVGELWYRKGEEKTFLSIALGIVEVTPDKVTILAQLAEKADEIDLERAQESKRRAEERLSKPASDADYDLARIALMKSLIRIQVATRAPGAAARMRSKIQSGG